MKFREFALDEALGVHLAHTLRLEERTLKKGRVLDEEALAALARAGIPAVLGARMEPGDLTEDEAAGAVAALLPGPGVERRKPYTGRCNLHALGAGVVLVDRGLVDRLNLIDESITVATLPPHAVVRKGQVVATVKIIPFAVPERLVAACRAAAEAGRPLQVAEFRPHRSALVLSELPGTKPSVLASTAAVTQRRLQDLGSGLDLELRCAHDTASVRRAIDKAMAAGSQLILISGATVTKDRADVVPSAIVAAGGVVEHFGMPVEPGNMLLLARIGRVVVLVLPGCARSHRTNGLDWVLQRLLAKLPVTRLDIMGMGVGGLIRSAPEDGDEEPKAAQADEPRTAPATGGKRRKEAAAAENARPRPPRVAALVLAAGRSTRMGQSNKLLAPVDGVPMVARAVNAARASRCDFVAIVTGHEAAQVEAVVGHEDIAFVRNPDYANGLSTSLRAGLRALPQDVDAVVVLLGDMPHVSAALIDRLVEAYDPAAAPIVVPQKDGKRGNPVLWPRRLFWEMQALTGDRGARELLLRYAKELHAVAVDTDAIFVDVDTPDALAELVRP